MNEFLKPDKLRKFWGEAPPYTTFPAAAVSATGRAGAITSGYQLLFEHGDTERTFFGGVISAAVFYIAAKFGHDNLKTMREQQRLTQLGAPAVAEMVQTSPENI